MKIIVALTLRFLCAEFTYKLQCMNGYRLVHRLDRETSGALVVARHADSAAWLSAAFARKSQGTADGGNNDSCGGPLSCKSNEEPWISRTYWAIVEAHRQLPRSGVIRYFTPFT